MDHQPLVEEFVLTADATLPRSVSADALPAATPSRRAAFSELTKPRITLMVVLTTAAGYMLTATAPWDWLLLLNTLLGTAMVASGASTLNQVIEKRTDSQMKRTANRPIPTGRLSTQEALLFGVVLAVAGMAYLALTVNLLTASLGAATLALYVFVYTPMKRLSSLATIVGAVPGAMPPMMGCTAAVDEIGPLAWALFGILFFWQMPHFLAIAWLYRSDYQKGGFPLLTLASIEGGPTAGSRTAQQMVLYAAALIPVSILPNVLGASGLLYFIGALVLGLVFLGYSFAFGYRQDARAARRLLLVSVVYLPVVLLLLVVDHLLI